MTLDFDLKLEESDGFYRALRTAKDEALRPAHDERAVDHFLVAIGHLRVGSMEDARRSLHLARYIEQRRGHDYADATLFLAAITAATGGDAETFTNAATTADPTALEPSALDELLWHLGVSQAKRRAFFKALDRLSFGPGPAGLTAGLTHAVRLESDQEEERNTAMELLKAARSRLLRT